VLLAACFAASHYWRARYFVDVWHALLCAQYNARSADRQCMLSALKLFDHVPKTGWFIG
jgi:hypothetical protein